ncbi:hypothetical protein Q7C36_011317 [Tachysurus vachellii]|uniref:Uncharacterized protein n=1 Tax=Tachysurus vachellii TaxID=175792 RepID=A0AA88MTX9_TACVA|nr:hypothetical protein Q7C36_011317 [Tachysurus vachellii]
MQEVTSDLHLEVAAMKNTKNKAQAEKRQAEEQKLQQDLYVERLMKQVEKLREQIALYEVQILSQTEDKEAARDALAEAQLELDSIVVEKKLQQLNSSMIEVKRRDEAYNTMQEALRSANHELRALDTELEGFNRSITQEQEKNEVLTVMVNRAELNRDTYKEALQKLCTTYTRTLQETEKSLTSVTTLAKVKGDSAAVTLEVSEVALRLEALSRLQLEQEQEMKERNQLLLTKEAAVTKLISTIERNQATISMYNKKIEQIRASTGHEDLGPLEIEVRSLNKQLEELSKVLRLDMEKLNSLLNQKTQLKQELEQSNSLMEKSFIQTLKQINMPIMLWERKIQLAKETRLAVESEVGKGDMPTIKGEIHRKELLKQREMMLREMEAAVARRENIVRRSEAQTQSNRKHPTRANLQNTLQNLQRNILQTHKMQITDLKNTSSTYKDDIKDMQETKEKNLIQLLALQSRVKQLQLVMEGRYRATARGEDALQLAMNTLQEELNTVRHGILTARPYGTLVASKGHLRNGSRAGGGQQFSPPVGGLSSLSVNMLYRQDLRIAEHNGLSVHSSASVQQLEGWDNKAGAATSVLPTTGLTAFQGLQELLLCLN